jgi:uncharacterized protein (TIGR02453 family)
MNQFTGFPKDAFFFFAQLAAHNNRDWFRAHQETYEQACREPLKLLVAELGVNPDTAKISRINRDMRFARGREPYKTYIATGVGANYLSLSAEGLWVGTGLYKPERPALERLRDAIDKDASGRQLERIVSTLRKKRYEVDTHERLASAPRGYDPDHRRVEFLRMKDIFAGIMFGPKALATRSAIARVKRAMTDVRPLADWVRRYVGARQ